MKFTCGLTFTLPLLLVLLLAVATKGHTELSCFVCDNCEKINMKTTPVKRCGGEMLSTTTTTTSSSMSPSSESTTTSSLSDNISTTTLRQNTPMPQRDSTTKISFEDPTTTTIELTTTTTAEPIIVFVPSTTPDNRNASSNVSSATPPSVFVTPSEGLFNIDSETGFVVPSGNASWLIPSGLNDTEGSHNRQRRHTEVNGITYYCYSIKKRYDKVFGTQRGCIGVKTELKVCDQLNMDNNNQTKKCSTCTEPLCNGSSVMGVSIATLLVALMAVIYKV